MDNSSGSSGKQLKRKYHRTNTEDLLHSIEWVNESPERSLRRAELLFGVCRKKIRQGLKALSEGKSLENICGKPERRPTSLAKEVM